MAQLVRYTRFSDASEASTFTFLLPPQSSTREGPTEILSREFVYGGLRWKIVLSKSDGSHLSPYLLLCSRGLNCVLDYSFQLLNRESFTQNEKFTEKQREFSEGSNRFGKRTFIAISDLLKRKGFATSKREFLLELTMQRPRIRMNVQIQLIQSRNALELDYRQYDTPRFFYGQHEWQLVFCPNMEVTGQLRHLFQLQRLTRSNSFTKIRYRLTVGQPGPSRGTLPIDKFLNGGAAGRGSNSQTQYKSGSREEILDYGGNGEGIYMNEDYLQYCTPDSFMDIQLELLYVGVVSQVKIQLGEDIGSMTPSSIRHSGHGGAGGGRSGTLYDPEGQAWTLAASSSSSSTSSASLDSYLSLSLYYSDIGNVPPGYLRYICWNARLLPTPRASPSLKPIAPPDHPLDNYYCYAGEHDRGTRIRFPIQMKDVLASNSGWKEGEDKRITVEIDWLSTQLLLHPTYSVNDDIIRKHVHQMRREVEALQTENQSLEKELHKYQVSIASKCATPTHQTATAGSSNNLMLGATTSGGGAGGSHSPHSNHTPSRSNTPNNPPPNSYSPSIGNKSPTAAISSSINNMIRPKPGFQNSPF